MRSDPRRREEGNGVVDTIATVTVEAPWLQTRTLLRVIFVVLAVVAALRILYALTGVLLLIVLSVFFAYLIAPLVEFACRPVNVRGHGHALPRPLAIGVVYLLILGALGLGRWVGLAPMNGTSSPRPCAMPSTTVSCGPLNSHGDMPLKEREALSSRRSAISPGSSSFPFWPSFS